MKNKNYSTRVEKLKDRRQGQAGGALAEVFGSAPIFEEYQRRAPRSESLQYALGAMQEVNAEYTKVSHQEKDRVTKQLFDGFKLLNKNIEVELQGSLALNIHLRRYSDVDLLVLPSDYLIYDKSGSGAGNYIPSERNQVAVVTELRQNCYSVLSNAYPQAHVDNNGAKSIALTGGSLRRKVDIVPSVWYDTEAYQNSYSKEDRGVEILDMPNGRLVGNFPFKYMGNINRKDASTLAGVKKSIRLLKTLRYDADEEISLSSFDIASLVWNMNDISLTYPQYLEPALLVSLQRELQFICNSRQYAETLPVADGTRKIVRSVRDFDALCKLNQELMDLIETIGSELQPSLQITFGQSQSILVGVRV